jgi:hypothetical protein
VVNHLTNFQLDYSTIQLTTRRKYVLKKIWLGFIVLLIGIGVYSLYGYLRLELPPMEEEMD